MLQLEARVLDRQAFTGPWERLTLHAPEVANRARPGQLLAVKSMHAPLEPLLRRPLPLAGADAATGTCTLLCGAEDIAALAPHTGNALDMLGPVGRSWTLDPGVRNLVLLGTDITAAPLLFLAQIAARRAGNVTLLLGAAEDRPTFPASLVPAAVEYQFSRGADAAAASLDLLDPTLLRWADALFTTLPLSTYPVLAAHVRDTRVGRAAEFAHGFLMPPMACYTGICDTCLVPEARRPWRGCVDGPVCDLRDFVR